MADADRRNAGTWEGARDAQLERARGLSVRERLRALDGLAETSDRLASAGRTARARENGDRHVVRLSGCRPTPLADYLKALGILRIVSEQTQDGNVRGWWRGDAFQLKGRLDRQGVVAFFRDDYHPTPILAPWNGGSGFYPKDNTSGIEPIEDGEAERFAPLRDTIRAIRRTLEKMGLSKKPDTDQKEALLIRLRSELDDDVLEWMDAAVLLTEDSPRYPPLLGTGGNDGRLEFTNNFLQRLVELFDPATGEAEPQTEALLEDALFGTPVPKLQSRAIGQFSPAAAGGPNATSGFEGGALVNPWDYVLMLEGSVLFAAAATRRLEATGPSELSYPFTVRASGGGSGGAALTDEGSARGEIWMPLWTRPASLLEIRQLMGEGRATVRRRNARNGLDFARAVATLGVARGVEEFQRFGFFQRYGRTYLATPLNRVRVRWNPAAELIDQLEHHDWLQRFKRVAHPDDASARLASVARRLEDALFDMALRGSSQAVQQVLVVLGKIMRYFAVSSQTRERCRPVPMLKKNWIENANDGSPAFELALAFAGLHVAAGRDGGAEPMPMIGHIAPVKPKERQYWQDDPGRDVVWGPRTVEENLRLVLERRLLIAEREDHLDRPLASWAPASASAVAAWLDGSLDSSRIQDLLLGLALCHIPIRSETEPRSPEDEDPLLPGAYRLLKPFFCTNEQLRRIGFLSKAGEGKDGEGTREILPLPRDLVRHLSANHVGQAVELAGRTLRARGFPVPRHVVPRFSEGPKLLAALMVPLRDRDLPDLVRPFRKTSDDRDDSSNTENHDGD